MRSVILAEKRLFDYVLLSTFIAFLGPFLLFMLQPMVAKNLLPMYGGASQVWISVMLVSMTLLFFGYWYAHVLVKLEPKKQFIIHTTLLVVSAFCLTIATLGWYRVVPAFFVLSSTTTLIQFRVARQKVGGLPYHLFAFSNLGSLAGLLSYPVVIEPLLSVSRQFMGFSILFVIYAVSMIFISRSANIEDPITERKLLHSKVWLWWLGLSIVGNLAVLTTTSQITQAVGAMPLLWVIPLSLYLASFVIAFSGTSFFSEEFWAGLFFALLLLVVPIMSRTVQLPFLFNLVIIFGSLFIGLVLVNMKLYRLRPDNSGNLPIFYLIITLGGVAASFISGIVAPGLFPDLWEYPIALILFAGVVALGLMQNHTMRAQKVQYGLLFLVAGYVIVKSFFSYFGDVPGVGARVIARSRNFYGANRVIEQVMDGGVVERRVVNGETVHGLQYRKQEGSDVLPTGYYNPQSGVGYAITRHPKVKSGQPLTIGVIGLGAGVLAGYCRPGDVIKFYEINPEVVQIARTYFTFLEFCEQSGGKVEIRIGDGRVQLTKELDEGRGKEFDVLVIDAFNDDSIPIHLLTSEAIDLYFSRLNDGGLLAFHTSSHYLNLSIVLSSYAKQQNIYTSYFADGVSRWLLMTKAPIEGINWDFPKDVPENVHFWTDQYSSVLQIIN